MGSARGRVGLAMNKRVGAAAGSTMGRKKGVCQFANLGLVGDDTGKR